MDFRDKKENINPRVTANPISKLFFLWILPLFRLGAKKDLDIDDLYDVLKEDESKRVGDALEKNWENECAKAKLKGKTPKFYKALIKTFGFSYAVLLIYLAVDEWIIRVAQVIYMRLLILSFSNNSTEGAKYFYATGLCVTTLLHTVFLHPTMYEFLHNAMKCRISACSLIYRKTLKLSKYSQGKTTVGQLVNLLSNDVNRFDYYAMFLPYLIIGPIQTVIFTYFLWEEFGVSSLAGMAFIVLLIPIQYYIGKKFTVYRSQIAKKTDERGKTMNEIIIAIRIIKMYAWEWPFAALINHIRELEVKVLRRSALMRGLYMSLYISSWKITCFFTFICYIYVEDSNLTADKVFFCVSIYNVVRQVMVSFFSVGCAGVGEMIISLNRIETFLKLEDKISTKNFKEIKELEEKEEALVSLDMVSASWTQEKRAISDATLHLKGDKLVMVIGSVGSGKSTFLHMLLGELPIDKGLCKVIGKCTYASQEPWIFTGNVKKNILFGQPFDESHYNEVIKVSALEEDLRQLPYGDNTIVGERGVSLSGGQKARVNLARALYRKSDIYLLDDPLSAVDPRVSRHIFEECVKKYLKGRLRILVTHQLQYLSQVDHIIVFENGKIKDQGSYSELVKRGVDFMSLMASENEEDSKRKESVANIEIKIKPKEEDTKEKEIPKAQRENLEKMAGGSVNWKTYWDYFKSAETRPGMIFLLSLFIICQLVYSFGDYWLSFWTNEEERLGRVESGQEATDDGGNLDRNDFLYIYTAILVATFVLTKIRSLYFFDYCMKIGIKIHNKMFDRMVRAPTSFYDENPSGRIMNRFTKDMGQIDELLPPAFFDASSIILLMIGFMVVITIANYYTIAPTLLLLAALFFLRGFYIKTVRDVKRNEAITRSPLFTHLAASIQGLTTIRSTGSEEILINQFDGHQDLHSASWYLFVCSNRGFGIWVELISVVYIALVVFSFLLLLKDAPVGNVGLVISSVLTLTSFFQWGMRQTAEVENLMTSVERALEYAKLDSEKALDSPPDKKPPKDWPSEGEIYLEKVSLGYSDDKDVLKDLTFSIKANEKIGICGRTGAGKSSIIAALFRMTEPRGNIYIDNVKINDIGLHDLRKKISIIPQEPILFSGTIRYNLDPFEEYKDDEIWRSLEDVNLKEEIPALDFQVSDGGINFSIGQRQLVCLARAILRNNRIIVLDEATANTDIKTDNFIQSTIRTKFIDCTIITIAHRLHSIMDCDKILVLDNGYIKEYDHPHILLQNVSGILSSMVRHTGGTSDKLLRKLAEETYRGRRASFSDANLSLIRKSFDASSHMIKNKSDDDSESVSDKEENDDK